MSVAYFIHRVQRPDRRLNLDRAYRWIRWLVDVLPDTAIMAPWIPYCEALSESDYRERGLRDGITMTGLQGISVGIVCGPEVTMGCHDDILNLAKRGIPSVTLTDLRFEEPPPPHWEQLVQCFRATVDRAIVLKAPVLWGVDLQSTAPRAHYTEVLKDAL